MRITIAERLRPYSLEPGTSFLLPLSTFQFTVYPARIEITDLSTCHATDVGHIDIASNGPATGFHIEQDLERLCIRVWGHTSEGFFRYAIYPTTAQPLPFHIEIEKAFPNFSLAASSEALALCFSQTGIKAHKPPAMAKLSLGNHKAQDCRLILRRLDLKEILPLWLRLGQLLPDYPYTQDTDSLMAQCQDAIDHHHRNDLATVFQNLFLAGFNHFLCPRIFDNEYQGFNLPAVKENSISPLWLLKQGSKEIYRLFFQSQGDHIHLLPVLPPEFHCGRLIDIQHPDGKCTIEWSKKLIRRMVFNAENDSELHFCFQKDISHFRLKAGNSEKGQLTANNSLIKLRKGQSYFFDRFT